MSLSYKSKKEIEERFLTKFLSNADLNLIVAAITVANPEPPDFKFDQYLDGIFKNVGIEITRVINPELKKEEAAQDQIIRLAREKFAAISTQKLTVYASFNQHAQKVFNPNEIKKISDDLFDFVRIIVQKNEPFQFKVVANKELPHTMFSEVTVSNFNGFENWQRFGAFRVPHINESWFLEVVERKEKAVHKYKSRFDEAWLLMVANFGSKSSYYQFSQLQQARFNSSPFDRIYIYKYMEDQAIRLK